MRRYLDVVVPRGELSDETKTAISTKYNNVMFDADAMANVLHPAEANKNLFPYYAKISFEAREAKKFSDAFNRVDFTSKFLVALKEVFGTGTAVTVVSVRSITLKEEKMNIPEQNNPLAMQLKKKLQDIQNGRCKDIYNWTSKTTTIVTSF